MPNYNLAILKKPYLDKIINGQKKIEMRLTKSKIHGFGRVFAGDKIFLKQSSGPVYAIATAEKVENYENLTPKNILKIKRLYNDKILGQNEHWQSKMDSKFGFLVWLKDIKTINPVKISKKDWRAWVVLSEKQNYGLFKLLHMA